MALISSSRHAVLACGVLMAVCTAVQPRSAMAVPLDIESCDKLVQQEAELERAGARANLAKGPQWAQTNLPQDKIEQVRKLIEIQEQVAFRCLRTKPLPAESLTSQPVPQPGAAAAIIKPKPKPRPVIAKTEAGATAVAEPAQQAAPAPKPKPVVKAPAPKPADSYVAAPRANN